MEKAWWEKNQYTYYKLPKFLLEDEKYHALSDGAKILFALILDRMDLSVKNGLMEDGTVYVLYTNREICRTLHWSHDKATRRLEELEQAGLIRRKKTKLGRPDRISVCSVLISRSEEPAPRNAENEDSGVPETRTTACEESAPIKNDSTKTDSTEINPSINGNDADAMEREIKEQIEYDVLVEDGYDRTLLDTMVRVMVDACTGTSPEVRVAGKEQPRQQVLARLRTLNMFHIQYVLDCLKKNRTAIRNMNAYLLTALYRAPETMDSYYQLEVQRDLAGARIDPHTPHYAPPFTARPLVLKWNDCRGESCRTDGNMDCARSVVCQSSKQGACMAHAPPEPRFPALIFGAYPNPPAERGEYK